MTNETIKTSEAIRTSENEELEKIYTYTGNMPCDNTGFCSGTSCPMFFRCQGQG